MPEVIVRKRLGRRSGDWRYQAKRWFYRHRPKVAVSLAFVAAAAGGLIFAAYSLQRMNATPVDAEPAPAVAQ